MLAPFFANHIGRIPLFNMKSNAASEFIALSDNLVKFEGGTPQMQCRPLRSDDQCLHNSVTRPAPWLRRLAYVAIQVYKALRKGQP